MNQISKHKIIAFVLGIIYITYVVVNISNYFSMKKDKDSVLEQVTTIMEQNNSLRNRINANVKLPANTDLSYYATNIYAYCLMEKIGKIDIKNGESKYSNTLSINLTFDQIVEKNKLKNFVFFLTYLGYVENVSKTNITLHVTKFSIEDAKRILTSKGNKND